MKTIRQFVNVILIVMVFLALPHASAYAQKTVPTEEKRCLTYINPCDPQSCSYNAKTCADQGGKTQFDPTTVPLSIQVKDDKRYVVEGILEVATSLDIAIGSNMAEVTDKDGTYTILTPEKILQSVANHPFIQSGYTKLTGELKPCSGSTNTCKDNKALYILSLKKAGKLLGIFNLNPTYYLEIGAQNGALIKANKPWFEKLYW